LPQRKNSDFKNEKAAVFTLRLLCKRDLTLLITKLRKQMRIARKPNWSQRATVLGRHVMFDGNHLVHDK